MYLVHISHKIQIKTKMRVVSEDWKRTPSHADWFTPAQAHLHVQRKTILIVWSI